MERVLIVEDNKVLSKIMSNKIVSTLDFPCDTAPTLKDVEGFIKKNKNQYFAAVLDLNLPDAKGEKVVDYVLAQKIPSIIFTGEFNEEVRKKMLKKNIVDYVIKETVHDIDFVVRTIHRIYKNQFIKVLVVDDSALLRKVIRRLLQAHRYQVNEAANGKEALEKLKENPATKLIITDYQMPVMNGFDLVTQVRKNYKQDQLAIIGISAHGSGILSAKFLKKGANDFITKPFVNEEFHCRINQNIEILEHIEAVREASNRDYLTSLCNRRYFFELGSILFKNARKENLMITTAMIDIDHFKNINDTYGHLAGDMALQQVSSLLNQHFKKSDIVSRFGGEEFCILSSEIKKEKVQKTFENLRKSIEKTKIKTDEADFNITVSIGITTQTCRTLDETINHADKLLYRAKMEGRNRVVIDRENCPPPED